MQIELVHIFVQVIRSGSFTRAAETLRVPKSTVSKAVSRLETETGTKLMVRTTRSQTLTAAGKVFYDSCIGPIQAIEDAQKSLSGSDSLLTGTIKVTAPEDLGSEILAPAMAKLIAQHPGLGFELNYTNHILDLVKEGVDLAVRIGPLKESGLKAKRVGDVRLMLVASPHFLKSTGKIAKPEDLKDLACLSLRDGSSTWSLRSDAGNSSHVKIRPRIESNQMSSLLKAAVAGAGVALVPTFLARRWIEDAELVRVLPKWMSHGRPVSIVSPLAFSSSARLRTTTDLFLSELKKALEQE
ncbi:MAG: LysR family transcriptional regulator [Bdellovibrionales bacterium]